MKKKILLTMMILSFFGMARVNYLNAQNVAKVNGKGYETLQTSITSFEQLKEAVEAGYTELTVTANVTIDEDFIIPESCVVNIAEGCKLYVVANLTNNGTINGEGSVSISTMVYVVETVYPFEDVTYEKRATKNGSMSANTPGCTVEYEISLDGGLTWITDTTNGKAQAVTVKTDGTKVVSSSFQSAYTSALTGEVVHLLKDVHVQSTNPKKNNGPLRSYYGLILEGNGHTIFTDLESSGASNEYATLKFTSYLAGTSPEVNPILKNVTIDSQNNAKADLDFVSGDVTFTVTMYNVNLLGNCQYASFAMKSPSMIINKSNVELYDCTIPSWDAGSANSIEFYSGEYSLSFNTKCTVYGGSYTKDPTNYLAEGYVFEQIDGKYVVFMTTWVAKVNDTKYTSLADAVEAATEDNNVITLLRDADGSGVVINKNVTIDFSNYTYSFTEGVGSTGTESNGFQILAGNNVTLKNGGLNVAESAKENFYILVQNYANLTVEDMNLDGTNLDKWSATDGDSYVLSNNSGNVSITGNTIITANDQGDKAFAFDSYDYSSQGYALPTVTVNTTGEIKGAIEVSATLNIEALGEGSEISYIAIEGRGQLFHNGLTTTIKKSIIGVSEEGKDGWYSITSPIEGVVEHSKVEGLINGTHDLYYYNETEMMWENVKDTEDNIFTTLISGQGYLYANTADTDLLFKGALNNGVVTREVKVTEGISLSGFNLIGNPFTHNISKANMANITLAEGFYILSNSGAWVAKDESDVIAPMQGVLVQAAEAGYLLIKREADAKRSENEDNGQIKINVANSQYNDVAYVSFNEGLGLDKIPHRNAEIPMVYIPVDGINYAIATMSQDVTEIPVSFKAATIGEYTIGADLQGCDYSTVTLVDRLTGIETNLMLEDYTFIAKSNDSEERFFIRLDNSQQATDNSHFAYINNGMISIDHIEGQGMLNIYDIIGRPVAEYNVATSANISTSDFAAGVYIIRMSDENGVKVQKIVVE